MRAPETRTFRKLRWVRAPEANIPRKLRRIRAPEAMIPRNSYGFLIVNRPCTTFHAASRQRLDIPTQL